MNYSTEDSDSNMNTVTNPVRVYLSVTDRVSLKTLREKDGLKRKTCGRYNSSKYLNVADILFAIPQILFKIKTKQTFIHRSNIRINIDRAYTITFITELRKLVNLFN